MSAREIIRRLKLEPHPEGGWYRQTFEDAARDEAGRARSTAIYYLLDLGETELPDLERPERLFQLVVPGLRVEFPPLSARELSKARPRAVKCSA